MASRSAKKVLGISTMGISLFVIEGPAASDNPGGLSRISEIPWVSSSNWYLPNNSYSAPLLSNLNSSHNSEFNSSISPGSNFLDSKYI